MSRTLRSAALAGLAAHAVFAATLVAGLSPAAASPVPGSEARLKEAEAADLAATASATAAPSARSFGYPVSNPALVPGSRVSTREADNAALRSVARSQPAAGARAPLARAIPVPGSDAF